MAFIAIIRKKLGNGDEATPLHCEIGEEESLDALATRLLCINKADQVYDGHLEIHYVAPAYKQRHKSD
jgi:hypothetical protein